MNKTIKNIQLIENLCNQNAYNYVRKVFRAPHEALESSKKRFAQSASQALGEFKL